MIGFYASVLHILAQSIVAPAQAAETGSISGHVEDADGIAVPGATVTLSGSGIAGTVQVTTNDDGDFRIPSVAPGRHQLDIGSAGLTPVRTAVTVRLDENAFVPVTLRSGSAEVLVIDTPPAIDTTRTAVSTELTAEAMQNLPTERSYQSAVRMLPGVSGRVDTQDGGPSTGNPSVRGEGQYGNNYLVDGISTRDPATKTFGTDVNFDAIADLQVYTDGAPAEFGQATGMLVNVVTKDGGDEHHGSAAYYLGSSLSWGTYGILDPDAHEEVQVGKRRFLDHELALTAGGPIVKEKLWYFASAQLGTGSTVYEGADPDYPYASRSAGGFAKLSWFINPNLSLRYQFNGQVSDVANHETSDQFLPESQSHYNSDDLGHQLTLRLLPNASGELEAQALYQSGHVKVAPESGETDTASVQNLDSGVYSGNYTSLDENTRQRAGGSLQYTQLASGWTGAHRIKAGAELWRLYEDRALTFTGPGEGIQYLSAPDEGYPCVTEDHSDCYGYTEYAQAGTIGHAAIVSSAFVQDDWQPIPSLSTNAGVRFDRETLHNSSGDVVVDSMMFSPRLGVSWDATNDKKTVVSVNVGRYYDLSGNTFADWGDTRSAFVYKQYAYDPQTDQYVMVYEQSPEASPAIYCNDQSLSQLAADERAQLESSCNGPLRPYHMDKLVIGIERELLPSFVVGIRGIASRTVDLPEDVNIDDQYFLITNPSSKRRDYEALELTANRRFDRHWQMLASYTLSAARGTMPGQFEISSGGQSGSNGNEVGVYDDDVNGKDTRASYFDAGYGSYLDGLAGLGTEDDNAGYYGYLPYHSFHSVKVNGSYTFDFGTTLGLVYEFDSGHAWQKRSFTELYQDYYSLSEGRGSRFMPAVHYVDVHLAHRVDLKHGRSAELTVDIFNLPDFKTPITYYENDNANFGLTLYRQQPRSIRAGVNVTY